MQISVQLSLPIAAAMICYLYMNPAQCLGIKQEIMLVLSVMSGTILFRLGRGIPYMDTGELSINDVKKWRDQ